MYLYSFKLDSCGEKQFIFEFSFENKLGGECSESNARYVSYRLLRKDKPKKVFQWEGCLFTDRTEIFKLSFPDEIDIHGTMRLFQNEEEDFIWIDTWYCQKLEEHFEGNILEIPRHTKPPVPFPDPSIIPIDRLSDNSISEQELILPAGYNDLFPYVYVRRWPDLTSEEETYFMMYINDPNADTLYNTFLSNFEDGTPKLDAREAIINETFNFINGNFYPEEYITNTRELPFPYKVFPVLYDAFHESRFSNKEELKGFVLIELDMNLETIEQLIYAEEFAEVKDRVWQNVFALSVLGFYNPKTLQNEIKILLVYNLLEALFPLSFQPPIKINHLLNASVVLPEPVFPLPLANNTEIETPKDGNAVIPYAIGDLHMTQHKLIGYQTGEIAHIENVLPGEIKERSNTSSHEITETSQYENKIITSEEQLWEGSLEGLTNEIKNTITGIETNEDIYSDLTTTYGPPTTLMLGGSVTKVRIPNLTDETNLTDFAKKVLNKALARMSRKIKQVFTKQQVNKTEEAVIHTLDNRNKDRNLRGIYNWVNKVYSTRVINYGNRFLLEFLIDHPLPKLEFYLSEIENGLIPPANRKPAITSFESINRENYASLAADYGVMDVPLPPEEYISSFVFFNEDNVLTSQRVPIEEGYIPFEAEVSYLIDKDMNLLVGATIIELSKENNTAIDSPPTEITSQIFEIYKKNVCSPKGNTKISSIFEDAISSSTRAIPVVLTHTTSYASFPTVGFYISVAVKSQPSVNLMNQWRVKVYDAITKAYTINVAKSKMMIDRLEHKNKAKRKELLNQSIKSSCKEILYNIYLEKNTDEIIEQVFINDSLFVQATEPAYVQFFEQAMEWNESTYEFYDADNPVSTDLINDSIEECIPNRFFPNYFNQNKLRVMIPVTPNFNYKMLYYLSTGFISYIENSITPVVVKDKPIAVALKEVNERNHTPCIHNEPWEILVPTNMQWLQDEDKLPFTTEYKPIN